jgi:predicted metal-dependent phosphoesterase TrpH
VAHPVRLGLPRAAEAALLERLQKAGLAGLEVYHSEHSPALQAYYRDLAAKLKLLPTGGSDFHGTVKPDIDLGSGRANNVHVPIDILDGLRRFVQ